MGATVHPRGPLVFISYRRHDSSAAARWLFQTIKQSFGPASAFMDAEDIRSGDDWADRIDRALAGAKVVIPVIGPHWLRLTDEYGRRRIDLPGDWVHREILHALQNGITLLPVLLSDTPVPDAQGLPPDLRSLLRSQAFRLRDDSWEQDLARLVTRLSELGFKKRSDGVIRYPVPRIRIRDLSHDEIAEALSSLPGWDVVTSDLPGQAPMKRSEIRKVFEFASFEDAIDFMAAASKHISEANHHPRWENIWRTVTIWLSTWDIGHKVSKLDLELAQYFEALRAKYRFPRKKGTTNSHQTPSSSAAPSV